MIHWLRPADRGRSTAIHGRMNCLMKQLQNAMLWVIGVMSVMALYLAVRSHSEQLADVAA
jgi:hypothetical protein